MNLYTGAHSQVSDLLPKFIAHRTEVDEATATTRDGRMGLSQEERAFIKRGFHAM